jgi:hypothetical protein
LIKKSARRLGMRVLRQRRTLREAEVVAEAVVDVEVELVAERGNVLLGIMITRSKAPTLVL